MSASTPLDWSAIIAEREGWVAHNFPDQDIMDCTESLLGMIEELGELCHSYLKMRQKIRGTEAEHLINMQDAVGDITIYMLGVMSRYGVPELGKVTDPGSSSPSDILFRLTTQIGALVDDHMAMVGDRWAKANMSDIIFSLNHLCEEFGWPYWDLVRETWASVVTRDWIAYPENGRAPGTLTPQEESA